MSKHVNMTGHYKVAGRERQGEGILQASQKGAFAQQRQELRREAHEFQAGPPAWETTPPNLEIEDRPKPPAKKAVRKKQTKTRKIAKARTRKATARKRVGRVAAKPARRPAAASKRPGRARRARS